MSLRILFHEMEDAAASAFFEKELRTIRKKMLETKYPDGAKAFRFFPVNTEPDESDAEFTIRSYDMKGQAKLIRPGVDDYPRVDAVGSEDNVKLYDYGASYYYSEKDIKRAAKEGRPLNTRQADVARKLIMRQLDYVAALGETSLGLEGFLNHSSITTAQAALNAGSTSRTWANKTADEVIADVKTAIKGVSTQGIEEYEVDSMILDRDSYTHLFTTPRASTSDTTIGKWLLMNTQLKNIEGWHRMKTAGTGDSKLLMVYKRDPDICEWAIPNPFLQYRPQWLGDGYRVKCAGITTGAILHHPLAFYGIYGI